jgi:ring-1,2-phenylacetyl-CoA epoxidase subunit PaaC
VTTGVGNRPDAELRDVLVGIADDELLTGHVLTSVAGWGPELEINIAMSSIGQDEIGHARRLYEFLLGDRAEVERFVYERPAAEFRATPLTRISPTGWESVLVRQYLYETADAARTAVLAASARSDVADLFGEVVHEERYHVDFWTTWLGTTARAGSEGRQRVQRALDELWPIAAVSFAPSSALGSGPHLGIADEELADAYRRWAAEVEVVVAGHGLRLTGSSPTTAPDALDGMLDEMRFVYRTAPGSW